MVLRRSHGERLPGRDEAQKRALGARHALLDNHRGAGIAEGAVEAGAHGSLGIFHGFGHDDALARRQAVSLDDDGRALLTHVGERVSLVVETAIGGRGNVVGFHERLGIGLGAFQLSAVGVGPEYRDAVGAQQIGHAIDQRCLGADDHQPDVALVHEAQQRLAVGDIQVDVLGDFRRAAVARRHVQHVGVRRLLQRPRDGMFAPTRTDQQNVHVRSFPRFAASCFLA